MKKTFLYFFTIAITIIITGCDLTKISNKESSDVKYKSQISKDTNEQTQENNLTTEDERIFIKLDLLGEIRNIKYNMRYKTLDINPEKNFTWWNHYTVDEYLESDYYSNYLLPTEIDHSTHDIIISFGRKLKYLYYNKKDYISDSEWEIEGYRARPIFEKEYVKGMAYVYLIDKITLADSELASDDMNKFLEDSVPIELPASEE